VDFMISVSVVVLALAVLVQAIELSNHAGQDAFNQGELYGKAVQATQLLVSNEAWTCRLGLGAAGMGLDNCLDAGKAVDKQGLGLGEEFGCQAVGVKVAGCDEEPGKAGNVVGLKRVVVMGSGLGLEEFRACRTGRACSLSAPKEVELRVWRK